MTERAHTGEGTAGLTMRSITGKLVLALIRGSDYAHAGEAEAIDRVFEPFAKRPGTELLDVGCGIGGTARYLRDGGWGQVLGVDIDPDNIAAARERHPGIDFICQDAASLDQVVEREFDVVYSLNAFFLFSDRPAALSAMRRVARPGARLAIFDYVRLGRDALPAAGQGSTGMRNSLDIEQMETMLPAHHWHLDEVETLHSEYLRWYEDLVSRIDAKRAEIVAHSSEPFFDFVRSRYDATCEDLRAGRLGGATFYATAR